MEDIFEITSSMSVSQLFCSEWRSFHTKVEMARDWSEMEMPSGENEKS